MLKAEIVMKDLEYTLQELKDSGASPVKVRRAFTRFITESQKLTESMRKEYSSITGLSWAASDFIGWNDITMLFKELRRTDYHESPVTIMIEETVYYLVAELEYEDGAVDKQYVVATSKYDIGAPFSDCSISMSKIIFYDENMIEVESDGPDKVEFKYSLNPCNTKLANLLELIGESDVIELSRMCYTVMRDYFEYYRNEIKLNRLQARG